MLKTLPATAALLGLWVLVGPAPIPAQATAAAARLAAWEKHAALEAASPFRDLAWRAIGPMQAGVRVEAIAVPPGNHGTIYVGVGSGNLWKTTNNGVSWTPIFEKQSTFTIGDVAVSPSRPEVVWVGTGETPPRHSGYAYAGTGVFRSGDGGATWTHTGLAETHHIGKVLIHPRDPDVVWVAALGHFWTPNAERGIFRTTDGGATWDHGLAINEYTGVVDLVLDPSDPRILYAAAWQAVSGTADEGGPDSGVYRSTDGGTTWQKLGGGLPTGPLGRIGLDVAPSAPHVVYAFVDNRNPAPPGEDREIVGGELYRSDDRGTTWRRTNTEDLYGVFGVYGWKFMDVRVLPDDPDALYILGNRAFRSVDGGRTFERIGEEIVRVNDTRGIIMHLDHHEIWIDPLNPERVLLGNDGGLYQSWDGGDSWLHLNNIPAAEFYSISLDDANPYRVFGGTQDNAALYGPSHIPVGLLPWDPWENVYLDQWTGGDSFDTYLDPSDPAFVYYEHQHGSLRRMDITQDSVLTGFAESIRPRFGRDTDIAWRSGWYTPFILSHFDDRTLYMGGNHVLKSTDRGQSWTPISPDLSDPAEGPRGVVPFGTITTLSQSRLEPGLLYAGTEGGTLWRTRDEGGSWERLAAKLPRKWASRVVASAHIPGRVYVSFTGYREDEFRTYLFASEDHGASWRDIGGTLPEESVNVIQEDPEHPDILYVGTDLGVWVSGDRGGSWHALSARLPTTPVHDLDVHPRAGELVIGTHGRSVFVLELAPVRAWFATGAPPADAPQGTRRPARDNAKTRVGPPDLRQAFSAAGQQFYQARRPGG